MLSFFEILPMNELDTMVASICVKDRNLKKCLFRAGQKDIPVYFPPSFI